jgi:hypothetical protein
MPPKNKPSAKGAEATEKELLMKAQAEIVALNRLLELKTYEVQEPARVGGELQHVSCPQAFIQSSIV